MLGRGREARQAFEGCPFHQRAQCIAYRSSLPRLGADIDPFLLHIYTALAQKERALISARTKAALRAAKAQGTVLGYPRLSEAAARARPLERAAPDQFAANLLPLVREIQKAGASSLNAIADALNKRGIRTARGKEWTHVQVGLILRRTT
jgi:DNA invertase Pin-like site-specific DNA recombinase